MSRTNLFGMLSIVSFFGLLSCGDGAEDKVKTVVKHTKEELKTSLIDMEDSLRTMQKEGVKIQTTHQIEYINRHLDFYRAYPKDDYAPVCLDKVQWMYLNLQALDLSIAYADTILAKYPDYQERALVLEAQGSTYDAMLLPRDSAKVRKYYTMLLDENPEMNKEKRDGIIKRLKNNHLTLDEWIMKNN